MNSPEQNRLAWVALSLTPGLGPKRILRAAKTLHDLSSLFRLSLTELESLNFPAPAAQFLFTGKARSEAERELVRVVEQKGQILTFEDQDYPEQLREIFDPPPVLWVLGDVKLLARPAIAVVGTRHPTPYGTGMAEVLARDLASHRMVILSGMARGVDTAAHRGALAAGGRTVAVWGTGIDVIYPKENKSLAENILVAGGAIVSEYRLGTFPAPQNFPKRNRIISGISIGVLVVEAGENSGTRVTARCALEQNRDVYAVPGNVTTKNAWGPNTLIKQGAKLVATWEDVWQELPTQVRLQLEGELGFASQPEQAASIVEELPLQEPEKIVLNALRHDEAVQLDELMDFLESKLTSSEIFTALFELELANRVKQLPGKNYVRRM
ncbi:MAG: processing protein [Acidobacteriaceae bacterium]|jgi:DNA processing protein|nr:processing protein [Acidobacteriaceae bacterium]